MHPRRAPSAARIAAQKIIQKTKGTKPIPSCMPTRSSSMDTAIPKTTEPMDKSLSRPTTIAGSSTSNSEQPNGAKLSSKPLKRMGLKVSVHGIPKHERPKKGRRCICEMCGEKFLSSTEFIEHYSSTHPTLKCKSCDKKYTNPLSLQKHSYVHAKNDEVCANCGKTFAFASQLKEHRRTHLMKLPCSHPSCDK